MNKSSHLPVSQEQSRDPCCTVWTTTIGLHLYCQHISEEMFDKTLYVVFYSEINKYSTLKSPQCLSKKKNSWWRFSFKYWQKLQTHTEDKNVFFQVHVGFTSRKNRNIPCVFVASLLGSDEADDFSLFSLLSSCHGLLDKDTREEAEVKPEIMRMKKRERRAPHLSCYVGFIWAEEHHELEKQKIKLWDTYNERGCIYYVWGSHFQQWS